MKNCKHCGQPIVWDSYWTTWDHADRRRQLTAELCEPEKGFGNSTTAALRRQPQTNPALPGLEMHR